MLNEYPDVLTVDDLKNILRIGKNKAYNLLKSNIIPSIRMGNTYRISKDAVKEFLCYNSTYVDGGA